MFSKAGLKKALMTLILVIMAISMIFGTLAGCNKFTRAPEKDPTRQEEDGTIKVELKEVSCLEKTPNLLKTFLDDEGDAAALDKGVTCIQDSLKAFMKHTRGAKADSYTGDELQHFFNKYLLKDNKVSDNFQHEIMKVKVVVVGGTTDVFTRTELEQFNQFLNELKTVGQKLHGKLRLLFFRKQQSEVTYAEITEAQKTLQEVSAKILDRSKVTTSRYQWVDLISFFTELNGFVGESKGLQAVLKWVPLAESVKLLFMGENAKLLTEKEWRHSIKWVVNAYSIILKFYYEIRRHQFTTPAEWQVLMGWLDEVLKGIETSPAMKEKKILEVQAIDRLAEEIYDLNLFKTEVDINLLKGSYRKAIVHFLDGQPGGVGDPQNVQGLTEKQFRLFQREYNVWKLSQVFLNDVYARHPKVNITTLLAEVKNFKLSDQIKAITEQPLEVKELSDSWADYVAVLSSDRPMLFNDENKLALVYAKNNVNNSYSGMNLLNFVRSITRLLLHGYGEKKSGRLFNNRITENGLIQLEEDFKDFGQRIGFLDPRSDGSAKRTFKEANWFAFHGNGDEFMTAQETMEELSILISGGQSVAGQIMKDLEKRGCSTGEKDLFNKFIMREACFVEAFRNQFPKYFTNMQWMVSEFSRINKDDNQFTAFYQGLMTVARVKPEFQKQGQIEYAEIRTITTILHYIDILMIVYDKDGNQMLNREEILAAAPRFTAFIEQESAGSMFSEYFIEDIFLYLIYEGAKPTGVKDLMSFKARNSWGYGEVGRMNLIKVLGAFKKDAKK